VSARSGVRRIAGLMAVLLTVGACGSDDEGTGPGQSSRTVRYEIVGNYSGRLRLTTVTEQGTTTQRIITSLPWSLDTTYAAGVAGVGAGGGSDATLLGRAGETANLRILVNNAVVRQTGPQPADASGIVVLPSLVYTFP
jgi:ABC-type Fe3+-hydroxamate transport system substrate-binding protein